MRKKLNTKEVTRYMGGPLSPAEMELHLEELQDSQDTHGFTQWPVIRHDDAVLGLCGLMIDDSEDSPCLGCVMLSFVFGMENRGLGYAREAALGCLRHAFETLDQHRVIAKVFRSNRPSWSLLQDIGMKPDHRLDYQGRYDSEPYLVYVMSWRDWREFKDGYPRPRFLLGEEEGEEKTASD